MATKSTGSFVDNLGRIYALYTGGFIGFTIILGILEWIGVPNRVIGYLFIFLTIGVYALIGYLSRTAQLGEYYVAGRVVPAFYNGMATGADWMSAASFIGMAGSLYFGGYGGLAFVLGWTGGYVLVATLMAPYLRKFGQYTVPDFFGARYGGNTARFIAVLVLIAASFTYVVAQIVGVGIITARFLGLPFEIACFVGLIGILVCSMLGGMKAVTWTQVAQYIILIIAYLIPVVVMSAKKTGVPVPQIMYGQALENIAKLEESLRVAETARHSLSFPDGRGGVNMLSAINYFALIFCLMVGTASLPHILMRYFTTPTVKQARSSVGWSIFFIFLLYFTAPAYAAFAKWEVYGIVASGVEVGKLPSWVASWSQIGLVSVCDSPVSAMMAKAQSVPALGRLPANELAAVKAAFPGLTDPQLVAKAKEFALCTAAGNGDGKVATLAELRIHTDAVVLATPEIAGLPYVIAGLVAAGGLAAALSTADGLLLAIANALSHDIYYKMIDPKADTKKRLVISRVLLIFVAIIAAYVAGSLGADILFLVSWAFSIAASGLFAGLVLGIWWKRTSVAGGLAGLVAGFGVCMLALVTTEFYGPWLKGMLGDIVTIVKIRGRDVAYLWGINNISVGIFGIPAAFVAQIVVTWLAKPASAEMQAFIDSIRVPVGDVKLVSAKDAVKE